MNSILKSEHIESLKESFKEKLLEEIKFVESFLNDVEKI